MRLRSGNCSAEPPRLRSVGARGALTAAALAGLLAAMAAAMAWRGVFLSRDWLFAWVLAALVVLSLGDLRHRLRAAVVDWLPLMAVLLLYDLSNGVREMLGIEPHVLPQLQADRMLTGGAIPSLELQRSLYTFGHPHWWDYAAFAVYLTHFFVTLVVAIAVWRLAHDQFRRLRTLVVALATAGFVTYVLFPAVPPWLAGIDGHIPPVHRIVAEMWGHVGSQPAMALFENRDPFYNEVAAVPSLHAAYPVVLLLFFWPAGRWARLGFGGYALLMALTLVYTGEHYVSDILAGWAYAGLTFAAMTASSRAPSRGVRLAPAGATSP
jgi:hypothetical protein